MQYKPQFYPSSLNLLSPSHTHTRAHPNTHVTLIPLKFSRDSAVKTAPRRNHHSEEKTPRRIDIKTRTNTCAHTPTHRQGILAKLRLPQLRRPLDAVQEPWGGGRGGLWGWGRIERGQQVALLQCVLFTRQLGVEGGMERRAMLAVVKLWLIILDSFAWIAWG